MSFQPDWGEDAFRYAAKYLSLHARCLRPYYDMDDLLQDAYILFVKICGRYEFDDQKHFIGVWRKSLSRMSMNAARVVHSRKTVVLPDDVPARSVRVEKVVELAEAPDVVKRLVIGAVAGRKWRRRKASKAKPRQTTNEYLCRLANISPDVPLRRIFDAWMAGDNFRHLLPNKD